MEHGNPCALSAPPPAPPPAPGTPRPQRARRAAADYRWTVPKVHAFLAALAQSGRVSEAARAVGMSRQAAYKLRERLNAPSFQAAFAGARRTGIKARYAASLARVQSARSPWEGPGLAALDYLRRGGETTGQGDARASQADIPGAQGDAHLPQSDADSSQGDGFAAKAIQFPLDRVPRVTLPPPETGPMP